MNDNSLIKLGVDQKLAKGIIESEIKQAILHRFNENSNEIISGVIYSFLNQRVDEEGKPSPYSSAIPMLDYLAKIEIKKCLQETMKEHFEANREIIKKELGRFLTEKRKEIISSMFGSMEKGFENTYHMNVKFEKKPRSEY